MNDDLKGIRVRASRQHEWVGGICIWVGDFSGSRRMVGTNVIMKTVEEGEMSSPTMSISMTAAQELMDSLWECGLRPSEGSGSAGALLATQRHLDDMRRIVFKVANGKALPGVRP